MFTNQLSMFDVIEDIQTIKPVIPPEHAGKHPALPVRWYIATQWKRKHDDRPEKARSRCRVYSPDGRQIAQLEQDINLEAHPRMRGLMRLPFLPLVGEGVYRFVMYCGVRNRWKKVSEIPVTMKYVQLPQDNEPKPLRAKANRKIAAVTQ
jgi:hypothetical protein